MKITRSLSFPLLLLGVAGGLSAQTETSPKGFLAVEANSYLVDLGAQGKPMTAPTYWRQVDNTLAGAARTLSTLRLRRDGTSANNTTAIPRTVKFSVRLAHADWSKIVNAADQADTQFLLGSWADAMTDKVVSLPDLRTQPASTPAPWSVTLPLDAPFQYSGQKALAFDFRVSPGDQQGEQAYLLDRYLVFAFNRNTGATLGQGCTATGKANTMSHGAYLTHYGDGPTPGACQLVLIRGPANSPCWGLIGTSNPNANIGLCTNLYCSGEVVLAMSTSSAYGDSDVMLRFPVPAGMIGQKLYSQVVASDSGKAPIPVALANGAQTTMPGVPVFQKPVAAGSTVLWGYPWIATMPLTKDHGLVIGL